MKNHLKLFPVIALLMSANVMSATLSKSEIYPPFLTAGCKTVGTDLAGIVANSSKKVTVVDTTDSVKVTQEVQLKVCTLGLDANENKILSWTDVNPFKGYDVQYFDTDTLTLKNKFQFIDTSSKANRFESILYVEAKNIIVRSIINENAVGTVEVKKLDLLDQNDLDLLDSGKEVKKVVILSNVLNVTTKVKGMVFQSGDLGFAGQNLSLTFIKSKELYKIKSIK